MTRKRKKTTREVKSGSQSELNQADANDSQQYLVRVRTPWLPTYASARMSLMEIPEHESGRLYRLVELYPGFRDTRVMVCNRCGFYIEGSLEDAELPSCQVDDQ